MNSISEKVSYKVYDLITENMHDHYRITLRYDTLYNDSKHSLQNSSFKAKPLVLAHKCFKTISL